MWEHVLALRGRHPYDNDEDAAVALVAARRGRGPPA